MIFNTATFKKATERLANIKQENEQKAQENKLNFHNRCPKATELERLIQRSSFMAAKSVLSGGNTKAVLQELKKTSLDLQKQYEELLTSHNLERKDITPDYNCKKCNDSGYIDGFMCDCLKNLVKKISFEELNSSTPLQMSSFEDYNINYFENFTDSERKLMIKNYSFCKNYAENFSDNSKSLLFYGSSGLGKTHLSLAIANTALDKGYGVVYGTVQDFVQTIEKERFLQDSDTSSTMENCDLLILDDMGVEFSSGYTQSILYNLINTRIMTNKATIISTNLSPEQIGKRYGERMISRFFGSYSALHFVGTDLRSIKKY